MKQKRGAKTKGAWPVNEGKGITLILGQETLPTRALASNRIQVTAPGPEPQGARPTQPAQVETQGACDRNK